MTNTNRYKIIKHIFASKKICAITHFFFVWVNINFQSYERMKDMNLNQNVSSK